MTLATVSFASLCFAFVVVLSSVCATPCSGPSHRQSATVERAAAAATRSDWADVPASNASTSWQSFDPIVHDRRMSAMDLDDGDGRGEPNMPGYLDPRKRGGSMLDLVGNGLREPVNAILSGHSDPIILSDAGLRDYVRTIGFSFECLDLHLGGLQRANLGDGNGWTTELFEFRQTESWGAPGRWIGACWETFRGGNHFRAWKQNGTHANTGAWFLAVSLEKDLRHHHTIEENGYNLGRDMLVEAAQLGGRWKIWKWKAKVHWNDDLLAAGRKGINHAIAQDGRVAVLTVYRVFGIGSWELRYDPRYFPWPSLEGLSALLSTVHATTREALYSMVFVLRRRG